MRPASALVVSVILCLLMAGCYAQSTSRFQSVSGEFAKNWISEFKAQNPQSAEESSKGDNLWGWGSAPRGSMILNGELIADPTYILRNLTRTNNWLGDTTADPYSSYPVYTYTDPNTGKQVYVYVDPTTGQPTHVSLAPVTSTNAITGGILLPPIFSSNDPWT